MVAPVTLGQRLEHAALPTELGFCSILASQGQDLAPRWRV